MEKMILYHGSVNVIESPEFGRGNVKNDYGLGFYCTEHLELAKEWACSGNRDGFANEYEIDLEGLDVLNLSDGNWHILNWMAILLQNPRTHRTAPSMGFLPAIGLTVCRG